MMFSVAAESQELVKTRLIVGFREDFANGRREEMLQKAGMVVLDDLDPLNALVAEAPSEGFYPAAFRLKANSNVIYVEEDVWGHWLAKSPTPFSEFPFELDPWTVSMADSLVKPSAKPVQGKDDIPWGLRAMKVERLWDDSDPRSMGEGVSVAVLDTGVDCDHPDLVCSYKEGFNAVDNSDPRDDNGHGTHVAGIIAARRNGHGVVGVAPRARIIPIKVFNRNGDGYPSAIIKGISWVVRNKIQVANMSFAIPNNSVFVESMIRLAKFRGSTLVAAAGNVSDGWNEVGYPAAYEQVIAVAAMDKLFRFSDISSRGKEVDFLAPGVDILSTLPGGAYGLDSGSSMASAHIAGLAAIVTAQGAQDPDAVRETLRWAAHQIEGAVGVQGEGVIDASLLRKNNRRN